MTLLERLREEFPNAKRQNLKRMVEDRRVLVNGKPARRLDQVLSAGEKVVVTPARRAASAEGPFPIVYEDQDVIVIDKPAGLLTSTVARESRATALGLLREYLAGKDQSARVAAVHRLDRDASGLLVFSKNSRAFSSLKRQFFHHTVSRVYHAVVSPGPNADKGRIESFLQERANGSVHSARSGGKRAVTDFEVSQRRGEFALLRVKLQTGRKHQIRVHLSEARGPILGDEIYGGRKSPDGLALGAVELAFDHPRSGKRIEFRIEPSKDRVLAIFLSVGS